MSKAYRMLQQKNLQMDPMSAKSRKDIKEFKDENGKDTRKRVYYVVTKDEI